MYRLLRLATMVALVGGLLGVETAFAVYPPPIKDDGKFFTKEAVDKADKKIRAIYDKYKKDVVVETLGTLSPSQIKQMEEEGKSKYFAKMALERARALGLNGIYLVIAKRPQHYHVYVDPATLKTIFRVADRNKVGKAIVPQFRDDQFDAGLLDGLDAIEAALKANSSKQP